MIRAAIVIFTLAAAVTPEAWGQEPTTREASWTLAAVGDVIMNRRVAHLDEQGDTGFSDIVDVIRDADVAFMNLEQSVFALEHFEGWPEAESGGGYTLARPDVIQELVRMGFDLVNRANNHATDYGVEGLRATDRLLDQWGLAHAGTGEDLTWASRPAYLDTPSGRFALLGMASTYTAMSPAGLPSGSVRGRPGVNALRLAYRNEASPATMAALRAAARSQGLPVPPGAQDSVYVFRATFYPGEADRVVEILDSLDRQRVLREVRNAANQADFVIVNSHTHEPLNHDTIPPDWLVEFSHDVIDAGATAFVAEGPHQLRGIEIYNGRPIFYSLGNFFFQNETIDPVPADTKREYGLAIDSTASAVYDVRFGVDRAGRATRGFPSEDRWYESVVVRASFDGEAVQRIELHPIDLNRLAPRPHRGTPRRASDVKARVIIDRLARLSERYGTVISFSDGIGVWQR